MPTVNEQLLNLAVSHGIYLQSVEQGVVQKIGAMLGDLANDLYGKVKAAGGASEQAALAAVESAIYEFKPVLASYTKGTFKQVAVYESKFWAQTLKSAIPVKLSVAAPSPQQVWAAAVSAPMQQAHVLDYVKAFPEALKADLDKAVRLSFAEGESIPELIRRIRGSKAAGYADGIIAGISARKAEALARTSIQHCAYVGRMKTFEENRDLIKGLEWVATLDDRTCPLCASRDGKLYSLDDHPEMPAHWGDRCTYVPVVASWEDLGLDPQSMGEEQRASMDGYQPASLKYEDWLKNQPVDLQQSILGQKRWSLWKGGEPLSGFIKDNSKAITVAELAKIEAKVDMVAGIPRGVDGADPFGKRLQRDPNAPKLGGSTGAFMAVDDEGTQWVVKQYGGNTLQVQNEWIANRLYAAGGAQVPEARLATFEGKLSIATRRLEGSYQTIGSGGAGQLADSAAIRKKFVLDAYLANWDAAGLQFDNMLWQPGKVSTVTRIDQGGALLFRAQGTPKGSAFGEIVGELKSLRDPTKNPSAAKLFSKVTDQDIANAIATFTKDKTFGMDALNALIQASGMETAQAQKLFWTLQKRWEYLHSWQKTWSASYKAALKAAKAGAATGAAAAAPAAAPAAPAPTATVVPTPSGPVAFTPAQAPHAAAHIASPHERSYLELKKRSDQAWNTLTPAERSAVKSFTGSGYHSFNNAALKGQFGPSARALQSGLAKLPTYQGYYGRGIHGLPATLRDKWWAKWKSGEWAQCEWKAFSSCVVHPSKPWSDAQGFRFVVRGKGNVVGGWVGPKSSCPSEAEYLVGHGAKFRVVGWAENGERRLLFLEEVDDPGAIPLTQPAPKQYAWDEVMQAWYDDLYSGTGTANPGPGKPGTIAP